MPHQSRLWLRQCLLSRRICHWPWRDVLLKLQSRYGVEKGGTVTFIFVLCYCMLVNTCINIFEVCCFSTYLPLVYSLLQFCVLNLFSHRCTQLPVLLSLLNEMGPMLQCLGASLRQDRVLLVRVMRVMSATLKQTLSANAVTLTVC